MPMRLSFIFGPETLTVCQVCGDFSMRLLMVSRSSADQELDRNCKRLCVLQMWADILLLWQSLRVLDPA